MDGILLVNESEFLDFVDPETAALLDYHSAELVGQSLRTLVPDFSRASFTNKSSPTSVSFIKKNGSGIQLNLSVKRLTGSSEKASTLCLLVQDPGRAEELAMKSLKTENDLKRRELELKSFFDSAPLFMGVVEHSSLGMRYIMVNSAVSQFLGLKPEEVNGRLVVDLDFNATTLQEWEIRCRQSKEWGHTVRWEFASNRSGSMRVFACHVHYIGMSEEGNERYSFASEEITEKKEMERKKQDQASQLSYLSKMSALGEMASGIAHEIYNPLSIVKGYADLIQMKSMKGDIDSKELLKISGEIQDTCRRITEIIEGLRFFAREGSRDPMEFTSIETIVSATLKICMERFRKYGVNLEVIHHDKNLAVPCREVQISQVILNLLNNAFDSVRNEENKRVIIETELHNDHIYIRVSDSGPGVPEMLKSKIFEPFFTTKPIGLGTGMGLSICKGIMETHLGSIDLIPSSHGACFQLRLPQGILEIELPNVDH